MPSLQDFCHEWLQNHGLSPMATSCRRFTASRKNTKFTIAARFNRSGQKTLLLSIICIYFGAWSGCANKSACNPYPQPYPYSQQQNPQQQFPQQQFPQQPYQAYPYPGQPGQPIQPSPNVGVPLSANGSQPGLGVPPGYGVPPTGYIQGQPPMYPGPQPGQPNPYYGPQTGQASKPFIGR